MTPRLGSHGSLFSAQSQAYAAFRPNYPPELFARIAAFAGAGAGKQLALDLGCGTGQVAAELANSYDKVVGVDPSASQLLHATQRENIRYLAGPAEAVSPEVAPGSADLITVAQAFHWMDTRRFYAEARRLLKPSGTLAIWGYGLASLPPEQAAAEGLLLKFYDGLLGPYWEPQRRLVEQEFKGLEPLASEFGVTVREEVPMTKRMSLAGLVGYLSSWSAYQTYLKVHPGAEDPLVVLERELRTALEAAGADLDSLELRWRLFLILARQPLPLPEGAATLE